MTSLENQQRNSLFAHPSGQQQLLWTGREIEVCPRPLVFDVRGYYKFIGVSPYATSEEIRRAIRLKAMECHPDMGGSEEDFMFLQQCKDVLLNPVARRKYDETGMFEEWLTPDEMREIVRSRMAQGDDRSVDEILADEGVTRMSEPHEILEEGDESLRSRVELFMRDGGFPWSFQYLLDDYDEVSLARLAAFHEEVERAIGLTDWKTYLRVGIRDSGDKGIEVEKGVFGAVVFWLSPGCVPTEKQVETVVAYAASGCDYARMLTTLGKMALRSKERIEA